MRLLRLDLLRYGHLADVALAFPERAGLCVVHGPNEMGKSTALAALGDALFGFGARTAFDFLHGGPQLRVGMTLRSANGAAASFVRRKGRAGTLRDAEDQPVPDAALLPFLGGAGRELFEQTFGLNGERLRAGGAALARGGGAVGESLFAAGTGLLGVRKVLAALDEEAKALHGDGRGRRRIAEAAERWKQAVRVAEERAVAPHAWTAAATNRAAAAARLAELQAAVAGLGRELRRLHRVRRVAPVLAGLDEARARLGALGTGPALPADAGDVLRDMLTTRAQAGRDAARETAEATRLAAERDGLRPDAAVLEAQDAIDLLAAERPVAVQAARDLPEVRATAERLRAEVAEAIRDFAREMTPEAARDAVPPASKREAVRTLLTRRSVLETRAEAARGELQAAELRREAAQAALQSRAEPADPARLRAAIEAARGEGRLDADLAAAEARLAVAAAAEESALATLPHWSAGAAALAAAPMPLPEAVRESAAALATAEAAVRDADAQVAAVAGVIAEQEDRRTRLEGGGTVPTEAAVRAARAARDAGWLALRQAMAGGMPVAEAALAGHEALTAEADRLADRRSEQAQRVADYLAAGAELDVQRRRQSVALTAREAAQAALAAAAAAWRALWAPAGIVPLPPAPMQDWLRARAEVLRLAQERAEAGRLVAELARRRDAAIATLLPFAAVSGGGLAGLLREAEVACGQAEAALATHQQLVATVVRESASVPALADAVRRAELALAEWQAAWELAALAGLGAPVAAADAEAALAAWNKVAEAAPVWRTEEARVGQMAATLAGFAARVRSIAAAVGAEADAEPLALAAGLTRRLAAARAAAAADAALAERIARHARLAATADEAGAAAEATLAGLRLRAGVEDDGALEAAIAQAAARAEAERQAGEFAAGLLREGEGLDEAGLRAEVSAADPDAAAARIDQIEAELTQLGDTREALGAELSRLDAELAAMQGGMDAAAAQQDARHAAAEAQEAAERYARLHVARVLLRTGIETFRRAQQGPLLLAAGRHLSTLTCGRYVRLGVDGDAAGRTTLVAVRDEGTECPVEALSEGTRDQLYLALRAAVIELHAESAEPLPFIADDLLAHFDDRRAAAAIQLLARLGRTTQVILFTHHEHVAALAEAQADTGVAVLRWTAEGAAPARALASA